MDYPDIRDAAPGVPVPEALLLDMDGVVADVSGSYREAIRRTAAHFGVEVTPEDIEYTLRVTDVTTT